MNIYQLDRSSVLICIANEDKMFALMYFEQIHFRWDGLGIVSFILIKTGSKEIGMGFLMC